MKLVSHFQKLFEKDSTNFNSLIKKIQSQVDKKYEHYVSMSTNVLEKCSKV